MPAVFIRRLPLTLPRTPLTIDELSQKKGGGMKKLNSIVTLAIAFIFFGNIGAMKALASHDGACLSGPIFTEDYSHFDGFDFETRTKSNRNAVINDFHWESTGYEFGGDGSIYGVETASDFSYDHSRVKVISETDLFHVTLDTCSSLTYEAGDTFSRISDEQIACVSEDSDGNGVYGDRFAAVRLNSHVDDASGDFAASANLSVVVLETSTPEVCDDDNPCTADACSLDGECSFETDLVLCSETLAPCSGPAPGTSWKNHGEYMKALAKQAKIAVENGQISAEERDDMMTSAAATDCGH